MNRPPGPVYPQDKYSIILADPPWKYPNETTETKYGATPYPTMDLEDIKSLPVDKIAERDSLLFLWTTSVMLPSSLEVIKSWGFEYIDMAFVWVKHNKKSQTLYSGLGQWTNKNAEYCLIAKKGNPHRVAKNVKQIVEASVSKHSEKPNEVHKRIVSLCGNKPRIELFSRTPVPGWDAMGNEVNGLDIKEAMNRKIASNDNQNLALAS